LHLAGEFQLAETQSAARAGGASPAEVKSEQLPQRVQTEATGHHRVAFEVTFKKPQSRVDIEFGLNDAFSVLAAFGIDLCNPVEHQHRRERQLRVAGAE